MQVKFTIDTGYSSLSWEEIQEFPDDASDDDIQAHYDAWLLDNIGLNWERLDD